MCTAKIPIFLTTFFGMSSQVPESEKYGLSFGSFESSYSLIATSVNRPTMSEKSTESYMSETAMSQQAEKSAQESNSR